MPEQQNTPPPVPPVSHPKRLIIEMVPKAAEQFVKDVNLYANGKPNEFVFKAFSLFRTLCQDSPNGIVYIRLDGDTKEQKVVLWQPSNSNDTQNGPTKS